jgi:hypothetical protein
MSASCGFSVFKRVQVDITTFATGKNPGHAVLTDSDSEAGFDESYKVCCQQNKCDYANLAL